MSETGTPNDEDVLLTYGALYTKGDVRTIGDQPLRLLASGSGGGLFTINSDPNVVNVDPLTGSNAPTGTDVGFAAPIRRWVHTGVLNGDFATPPPDADAPIGPDNVLDYWLATISPNHTVTVNRGDATLAARRLSFVLANAALAATSSFSQWVPIPTSYGQQYRVFPSLYQSTADNNVTTTLAIQFYTGGSSPVAVGSALSISGVSNGELKLEAGLVPQTAEYALLTFTITAAAGTAAAGVTEVRCAFLPAEAATGLYTRITDSNGITNTQTQVATATIPANTFVAGARYRIRISGTITSSAANAVTMRIRVGPTSLTGAIIVSQAPNATTTASNDGFVWEADVTCRTVGASGTLYGSSFYLGSASQPFAQLGGHSSSTAAVTVDTTVSNILEATVVTAAATTTVTVRDAVIVCERSA